MDYGALCSGDPRIHYLEQTNAGSGVARNRGILASESQYVAFLDADDAWERTKLGKQIDLMERDSKAVLCYTDFERGRSAPRFTQSGLKSYSPRHEGLEFYDLLAENFCMTASIVLRRSVLSSAGLFDRELKGAEDIDLWLRVARAGRFCFLNEILTFKRDHQHNTTIQPWYLQYQIKAREMWLARYREDARAARLIESKLAGLYFSYAYALIERKEYGRARKWYWRAATGKHQVGRSSALYALMWLPNPWITVFLNIASGVKNRGRHLRARRMEHL